MLEFAQKNKVHYSDTRTVLKCDVFKERTITQHHFIKNDNNVSFGSAAVTMQNRKDQLQISTHHHNRYDLNISVDILKTSLVKWALPKLAFNIP